MADDDAAFQSRCLLRAARAATLATAVAGQPFASLVTPATAPDLSMLLLLSSLSEHTRHLVADPRCSLLVAGAAADSNPQTAPRVTITGVAEQVADPALKARWLQVHPYGALYADFADFALWRIPPAAALLVGGFARATRLRGDALRPDPAAVAAIAAAAADIIDHCNADHADAMTRLARSLGPLPGEASEKAPQEPGAAWRMVGVDVDGCDLAPAEGSGLVRRAAWPSPVGSAREVRTALIRLLRA